MSVAVGDDCRIGTWTQLAQRYGGVASSERCRKIAGLLSGHIDDGYADYWTVNIIRHQLKKKNKKRMEKLVKLSEAGRARK